MSGVNLTLDLSQIPDDLKKDLLGRSTPNSLDKLAQVSHDLRSVANQVAQQRLNRSFGGAITGFSPAKELFRRSIQWPRKLGEEAYAKLGKVTAALQTEKVCIVSVESPFLPQVKEMVILNPPSWEASFPLENTVTQILSFREGNVIVFTQNGLLEKYVVKLGKIATKILGLNYAVIPVIGEQIPFIFVACDEKKVSVVNTSKFEFTSTLMTQRAVKAILHINSNFTFFFKDGFTAPFSLDPLGMICNFKDPEKTFLSPLTQFKAVSSNLHETHFTVDASEGTGLFFYDHMLNTISWVKKKFSFEKMIRIQEYILGLYQNAIYFEGILDHKTFDLFSPQHGKIIDFCPSEEGILRVLVQQYNRIVLFRLIFPPYKKPFVEPNR